jgi:hypothetical protein
VQPPAFVSSVGNTKASLSLELAEAGGGGPAGGKSGGLYEGAWPNRDSSVTPADERRGTRKKPASAVNGSEKSITGNSQKS